LQAVENVGSVPLYLKVAHHLESRIADGTYPVGSLLPPEAHLAEELGVSRHTVRQAIARLKRGRRLSARKGVGTRVEPVQDDWRSRFRAESRNDLFDFARETELHFHIRKSVAVRGAQASRMGVRSGRKWAYLAGPRYFAGEKSPFCWNEVYLDPNLASVVEDMDVLRVALFMLVERHTGERITEIQQEIRPTLIEGEAARGLGVPEGTLGLELTRRYLGSGRRLLEYAVQTGTADAYVYRTILSSDQDADGLEDA
jgi:GntR family transcriptional regulator